VKSWEKVAAYLITCFICSFQTQNVKAVFDAAIKAVLQPLKQKKKKKRQAQKACSILWLCNKILEENITKIRRAGLIYYLYYLEEQKGCGP
jgi:hypothetical protein